MKKVVRFIWQLVLLTAVGIGLSMLFTNCKKDVDTDVTPSIVGEWETVEHLVYYPDTVREFDGYNYLFRDNGYVLVFDDDDTISYTYETVRDSIFMYDGKGNAIIDYSLILSESSMRWEQSISYDPLNDFETVRRVKLERK